MITHQAYACAREADSDFYCLKDYQNLAIPGTHEALMQGRGNDYSRAINQILQTKINKPMGGLKILRNRTKLLIDADLKREQGER